MFETRVEELSVHGIVRSGYATASSLDHAIDSRFNYGTQDVVALAIEFPEWQEWETDLEETVSNAIWAVIGRPDES